METLPERTVVTEDGVVVVAAVEVANDTLVVVVCSVKAWPDFFVKMTALAFSWVEEEG